MLIAHITDTHITTAGRQERDLRATLAWINAQRPAPDVILLSGDTANNGRHEQYTRLRDILAESDIGVFVVPGNHDRRPALRAVIPDRHYPGITGEQMHYALDTDPVRIVGLDTTASGRPGGILDDVALGWLESCLSAAPTKPTLLFMHHPPFRTGVNLADVFGFAGLRRFETIVESQRQVVRIISGHVHCERRTMIAQALVTTSISSTPQLVPEVFERHLIGMRPEPAGFALLAWHAGGFTTTTYVQTGSGAFSARADLRSPDAQIT